MAETEAHQAAQLLATFGGQGFGPSASKPLPAAFGGGILRPLARVAEDSNLDGGAPALPTIQTSTPLQRSQRLPVFSMLSQHAQRGSGSPRLIDERPPGSPSTSMLLPRGPLDRAETADSFTAQAMRNAALVARDAAWGSSGSRGLKGARGEPMFVGPSRPRTAAARALLAGNTVHPVVRLGWKPLCEVHCNGLTGFFLGGHDRDLYIKCTAAEYVNLPLVDVSQGGCIMTCSYFEKAAGRELSKKWKESIHVSGEGEGSKATLLAWLKRRAEADFGSAVVGRTVWVCWCADAEYYLGDIISYSRETGKHKVKYSDRFVEELHLPVEKLDFGHIKPTITFNPADCGFSHMTHRLADGAEAINRSSSAPAATLRSYAANAAAALLHHQCSNVSTSSAFHDAEVAPPPTADKPERRSRLRDSSPPHLSGAAASPLSPSEQDFLRPPPVAVSRRRRTGATSPEHAPEAAGTAAGGPSGSISGESDGTPVGPPPKKRRSGLPSVSIDFASRLAEAGSVPGRRMGLPAHWDRRPASLNTWLPSDLGTAADQQPAQPPRPAAQLPPAMPPQVPDLAARAPPPEAGAEEMRPAVVVRWMSRVAMHLDDSLSARAAEAAASDGGKESSDGGSGGRQIAAWGLSPSARFQALLVQARQRDGVQGYYEAMLDRHDFFKDQAAVLQRKMEDFILAALLDFNSQHQQRRGAEQNASKTSSDRSAGDAADDAAN